MSQESKQMGDTVYGDKYTSGDVTGQVVAIGADARAEIHQYTEIIVKIDSIEDLPPAKGDPPFKGLAFFREADADLFFGREALSEKLASRLQSSQALAVIGASGSGKSSLLRAGVVPRMRANNWMVRIITPTANPLERLANVLTLDEDSLMAVGKMVSMLANDPQTLNLAVNKIAGRANALNLLLVIDQFEELFTLCRDEVQRQAFLDNLFTATSSSGATALLIGIRADFYDYCLQYEGLRNLLAQQQEPIGPMKQEELVRVIAEPAKRGGWQFVEGLVEQILEDIGREPGRLPLLSHALLETWVRRRGTVMTLAGYRAAGGVEGAIAKTAEDTLKLLDPAQEPIVEHIFLSLTELGEGSEDTRRIATKAELERVVADKTAVSLVLEQLVRARLITLDGENIEVAHEALIRRWPRLHNWLQENRERIRFERQLAHDARVWFEDLDQDPGALYRGARLAQAIEWIDRSEVVLEELSQKFINTSREMVEKQQRLEEEQQLRELEQQRALAEEQRQRAEEAEAARSRLKRWISITVVALVIIFILAIVSGYQTYAANETAKHAEADRLLALNAQATAEAEAMRADANFSIAATNAAVAGEALLVIQERLLDVDTSLQAEATATSISDSIATTEADFELIERQKIDLTVTAHYEAMPSRIAP